MKQFIAVDDLKDILKKTYLDIASDYTVINPQTSKTDILALSASRFRERILSQINNSNKVHTAYTEQEIFESLSDFIDARKIRNGNNYVLPLDSRTCNKFIIELKDNEPDTDDFRSRA